MPGTAGHGPALVAAPQQCALPALVQGQGGVEVEVDGGLLGLVELPGTEPELTDQANPGHPLHISQQFLQTRNIIKDREVFNFL